jgi:hypothetical protein
MDKPVNAKLIDGLSRAIDPSIWWLPNPQRELNLRD